MWKNEKCLPFCLTFEKGFKFSNVNAEKTVPCKQQTQCQARGKNIHVAYFTPKWSKFIPPLTPNKLKIPTLWSCTFKHLAIVREE